ncbi:hypothetical protein SAMN02745225_01618 [Ferrithrix thermotolerans DSM 19514]|uniref:Uncharacterized protein n=1 Tax=Ferrithrix thermotolerans DSM 19514 TaxID=1121881 RepID=A0A1M4WBY0_9ACTN|nr:hypothetical protein SAMN02745225_01618 [Ferrithrix thermotolerans DSM 19514]
MVTLGGTSSGEAGQAPVARRLSAATLASGETGLREPDLDGLLGDSEVSSQVCRPLDSFAPSLLQPGSGHEEAAGEVVADALDEVFPVIFGNAGVEDVDEAVVDDVLELVCQ